MGSWTNGGFSCSEDLELGDWRTGVILRSGFTLAPWLAHPPTFNPSTPCCWRAGDLPRRLVPVNLVVILVGYSVRSCAFGHTIYLAYRHVQA